jgi:hypothetical protein
MKRIKPPDPVEQYSDERQFNRGRWVLLGFLVVAAFFLWTEHRAHFRGVLPYLLILACPLMHLFHHGHEHRHRQSSGADNAREPQDHAGKTR